MRKYLKYFKIRRIEVYIFAKQSAFDLSVEEFPYTIKEQKLSENKTRFFIEKDGRVIHESYLYLDVFLLGLLKKRRNPVIGDCLTDSEYRGQGIYPYVINQISNTIVDSEKRAVYMVVNQDNESSIKGIEKAGFTKYAEIKAKRWTWIYLNKTIRYLNKN
ncbi:GNAT family N-acetyltransferase [Winogradskyella sp.]|uniref:GNAT family N-acetyltransferase n=1 Tax=Winogradskyella sp. TaxID=1883156 RepID=UPI003BA8F6A2